MAGLSLLLVAALGAAPLQGAAYAPYCQEVAPARALHSGVPTADDDCGPPDCVGYGHVWAPMYDQRDTEAWWQMKADDTGYAAVGSWFDTRQWLVEVFDPAGDLVGEIRPTHGNDIFETRFCTVPGAVYDVRIINAPRPEDALHYRMYWRGVEWVRSPAPIETDAEVGFDYRWGHLPAKFNDHTWYVEVEPGATELTLSWEHVTGDDCGRISLIPPDGSPPQVIHPFFPGAGWQHWPARYPDCWGTSSNMPIPPPPVLECTFYDIFDPVPDPAPGFWGVEILAWCDGDPNSPEPDCDPYAHHYVLDRKDGGSPWFYLDRHSFENPDIQAIATGSGDCGLVRLDGSASWTNSGGMTWAWYDEDGILLGTDPVIDADLGRGCTEVLLEVGDRCELRDTDTVVFTEDTPPDILCPPPEVLAVDDTCRGVQGSEATADDDCTSDPVVTQDPSAPAEAVLGPDECRRFVPLSAEAEDECGNRNRCSWTLTFADFTPPQVTCPPAETLGVDDTCRGVQADRASAEDNCADPDPSQSPAFPVSVTLGADECRRSVDITAEAFDACGNRDDCGWTLSFEDRTDPVASCPPDEVIPVDESCRGAQTERATAADNCASPVPAQDPGFPVQVTLDPGECRRPVDITATASDACNNRDTCGWTLSFEDVTPPSIRCPRDGDATPDLFEVVADADCRGVFDERATATDNCDLPAVTSDPPLPLVLTRADLDRPRPVAYTARDACDLEDACSVETVLVDETPPVFEEVRFDGGCLWPPNHKYVCLEVSEWVSWSDNCTEPGTDPCGGLRALSCAGSQPENGNGDGNTVDDCRLEDGGARICLRSERQGREAVEKQAPRAYTILLEATDCAGNASTYEGVLLVPHDRSRGEGSCTRDITP